MGVNFYSHYGLTYNNRFTKDQVMDVSPADCSAEDYMNDKQVEHFKTLLESERSRLNDLSDRQLEETHAGIPNQADPVDKASLETDAELTRARNERTAKQITAVFKALTAITENEYGYCSTCGDDIGVPRLTANPVALDCIDCQSLKERRQV